MQASVLLDQCRKAGIDFFSGVPDSQLKGLCDELYARYGTAGKTHIVAHNEGGAVALCAGHYLASGKPGLCYMQNSGLGNAVNPLASLMDPAVYGIPCLLIIGWRGEPGVHDEPQHVKQGKITLGILAAEAVVCVVFMVLVNVPAALAMIVVDIVCVAALYPFSRTQFGGMSGDLAGFFLQSAELCMLVALVIVKVVAL